MTIDPNQCQITHYPAGVLGHKAEPVKTIDDNLRAIVDKMTDIMLENKGIGLAAPQAGLPLRLFIIALEGNRESVRVYINPQIKPSGKLEPSDEGCLSVPGLQTHVRRYTHCTVTATDLDGRTFTDHADGLYARALQHEYDHLEGITIANKMGPAAKIRHRKLLKKLEEKSSNER